MNIENFKDPLIVSLLFFVAASEWFDNWLKDMFPQLRTTNPMIFTLIKTAVFAGLYWLYHLFMKKTDEKKKTNGTTPASTTPSTASP